MGTGTFTRDLTKMTPAVQGIWSEKSLSLLFLDPRTCAAGGRCK